MKKLFRKITDILKWKLFNLLDFFAQRGSTAAHKLACLFLPY
jgi:hypothetical protein